MPAVNSGLVLVTGASGFVGTYAVKALLDAGFSVRGTVRSAQKGEHLKELSPKASYVIVEDMSKTGAYDEAVVGVDAVVHVASPLDTTNEGDPNNVIGPAVAGVTGILHSLEKNNPKAKRIVDISSVAAVGRAGVAGPGKRTEADWNNEIVDLCDKLGAAAPGGAKYSASKTVAEKAFWSFLEEKKPAFDGVVLNPGLIFGPPTQFTAAGGAIVGSNASALPFMRPGVPTATLEQPTVDIVDVRDVAAAIVAGVTTPAAGGERFIIAAAPLFYNDFAVAAAQVLPEAGVNVNADPAYRAGLVAKAMVFDGSKATRVLGLNYRDKDATLLETVQALSAKQKASV